MMRLYFYGDGYVVLRVTPRLKKVITWQPSCALVWVLIFQNLSKDSQCIWHPSPFEKRYTSPPNKSTKFKKYFNT